MVDLQEIHHQQRKLDLINHQTLVDLERTVKDIKVEIILEDLLVLVEVVLVKQVVTLLILI